MSDKDRTYITRISPVQMFLTILVIVFITELIVMFILEASLPANINHWLENTLDSFLLTFLIAPIVWWVIVRPLQKMAASSQAKYAAIVDAVVEGIISMDDQGIIESFNPAAENIFGYSARDVMGNKFIMLFDELKNRTPENTNSFIPRYLNKVAEKVPSFEITGRRKDNTTFPVELSVSELKLDNRTLYTMVIRDVTRRKLAEVKIRQLSHAVEQSPTSVVITDTKGNIEYVNPKFSRLTGYSLQEVIGKNPRMLKSGECPPEDYKALWDAISGGEEWHGEFHNKKKNGELYWEFASISPVFDGKGKITHYLAVKEDITERKRQEDEINRLNEDLKLHARELESANKELEAFSYSVSHDLRNPLGAITGYLFILDRDYKNHLNPEMIDHLERIKENCKRMKELIQDMLMLSHASRKELSLKSVDLTEMANNISVDLFNKSPGRKVEFLISTGLHAQGDEGLLKILLDNLLGNAWKYSGKTEKAIVEFGVMKNEINSVFFVRDNGAGFDMAKAEKLFEPFQRLHPNSEFEGTGVGLATVHRVVQRHGGKIWAESSPGKGATFFFTLSL